MQQLVLLSLVFYGAQMVQPAKDFGFRLERMRCRYERIDSFSGTFSMYHSQPLPMILYDDQRRVIFQAIMSARFFDLSAPTTSLPSSNDAGWATDAGWELEVRNDGRIHRVLTGSGYTDADRRTLSKLIETILAVVWRTNSQMRDRLSREEGCVN